MIENPLVCICIPNYNNEKTISKTLDSLVLQTYKNIIIKIFDNASTDGSMKILREYETKYPYIQVLQNETNIGGEANFTKCIQNFEGEYGAVFHADDIYLPMMIKEQVMFLEKNKECSAVAVHANIIDENSHVIGTRYIPDIYTSHTSNIIGNQLELLKVILRYGNFITCPSVMARSSIYRNKIVRWNGNDFKTSADLDVWLRLASFGNFGFISKTLMQYRESIVSYSYKDMRSRIDENNMFLVLDYHKKILKKQLSNHDLKRYSFLTFKDNINRTINQIILQKNTTNLKIEVFKLNILLVAFESKQNLKIYMYGFLVKILRNLFLPKFIINCISKYRFGK